MKLLNCVITVFQMFLAQDGALRYRSCPMLSPRDPLWIKMERNLFLRLLELDTSGDVEPLMRAALAIIVEMSRAAGGYVELHGGGNQRERGDVYRYAQGFSERAVANVREQLSDGIMAEALACGETVRTACAMEDGRFEELDSVQEHRIGAVVCVPIGEPAIGVVYLQARQEGFGFTEEAVRLTELFARHLASVASSSMERVRLRDEADATRAVRRRMSAAGMVGRSVALAGVLEEARVVAGADVNVVLTGPSGAGKTELARVIHQNSTRAQGPFVVLNCAGIPDSLFESELFGARQGAHSTALHNKEGIVARAAGGTLVLDEVAELSLAVQAKLLQFIETKQYWPLGAIVPSIADVRIISATHADLAERVAQKRFRDDLRWRLNVMSIRLPPLIERREDVAPLASHFCESICQRNRYGSMQVSPCVLRVLELAEWRGNVRELRNAVEAAVVRAISEGANVIAMRHVFPDKDGQADAPAAPSYCDSMNSYKRFLVLDALQRTGWNVSQSARELGLARSYFQRLIQVFGFRRPTPQSGQLAPVS